MNAHFSFPIGPGCSVATVGNDCHVEDRVGEKEAFEGAAKRRNAVFK